MISGGEEKSRQIPVLTELTKRVEKGTQIDC